MSTITTRIEPRRGCGYRKPGGLYLVAGSASRTCCKLPFPLTVCPCCGAGIKPARGFTWISTDIFSSPCIMPTMGCILSQPGKKIGLLWVGEKYYPTPESFARESIMQGVSKRIAQIPRDLVVGETWIALAHRAAITDFINERTHDIKKIPGIFSVFIPKAIEYIVTGEETEEKLLSLEKRGVTLIKVIKDTDAQTQIF